MVKKLISLLNREWRGLHEAAILIGLFTLLSQIIALFRDRLLAHSFGATETLDIYYSAFRIPDLMFAVVGSFMSALVIIPLLTKYAMESDERAHKFLNGIFTFFFAVLLFVSVGLFVLIPIIVPLLFPNFAGESLRELILVTRILLISPMFFSLSNLLGSVTQMLHKFFALAITPVLYNLGIIAGIIFFYPAFGITGLAIGVAAGSFLHFFVHFFVSSKNGFTPMVSLRVSFVDIVEVVRVSLPRTIGLSVNQIALSALVILAAQAEKGSVAVLNFALNLQSVPLALVGVSYATAAFPALSRHFASDEIGKFIGQIIRASRSIIFWSLPMLVLFIVLRAQIVRTILGSGSFDWTATRLTAAILALFIASIVMQSLALLFVRGFYATGDNKIPLIANTLSAVLIVVGGYGLLVWFNNSSFLRDFFASLLRVEGLPGTEVLMLPLAYSLGMFINTALLIYLFRKRFGPLLSPLKQTLIQGLFASLVAGLVAYEFLEVFGLYLNLDTFWGIFLQGLAGGIAGLLTWGLILELMNNADIKDVRAAVLNKFWKSRIVVPDKEEI